MHNKSIAELSVSLASGEFSSEELTKHFLKRIETYGEQLNCFVTVTAEPALQAAREADAQRAQRHFLYRISQNQLRLKNAG